jgi:hypothetical protein
MHFCQGSSTCQVRVPDDARYCSEHGRVWKPWSGEPTLESVVKAYCDQQRSRYELLDELACLRAAAVRG